jgi:hypothetical protein
MSEPTPRDVIMHQIAILDINEVGWRDADAILDALDQAGYVVVPKGAIQHVIDECTAPDNTYYNLVDGERLRAHMRHMLNGSEPSAPMTAKPVEFDGIDDLINQARG